MFEEIKFIAERLEHFGPFEDVLAQDRPVIYHSVLLPLLNLGLLHPQGGGYIHKMSNYCEHCRFSPLKKTGPDACPFNALYWEFHARHADRLRDNPRVSRTIQTWEARHEA